MKPPRGSHSFALLLPLALFAWTLASHTAVQDLHGNPRRVLFDDAMVSLRYAHNLVLGDGLVWNRGERVEGFTNPLWTLLMAALIALSSKEAAPGLVQLAGIALLLVAAAASARVRDVVVAAASEPQRSPAALGGSTLAMTAVWLLWYPSTYWAVMGMEVSLCLAIHGLALYCLAARLWGDAASAATLHRLGVLLATSWLVRPDAPLLVAPLFAVAALAVWRETERLRALKVIGKASLVPAAAIAALSAFRVAYYGSLLPNTYVLKMTGYAEGQRLANGLAFVRLFVVENQVALGALLAGALFLSLYDRRMLMFTLIPATVVGYQVYVGGDPWVYWRQLAPVVVSLAALIGVLVWTALGGQVAPHAGRRLAALALAGGALAGLYKGGERFRPEMTFRRPPFTVESNHTNLVVGEALREVLDPEARILAFWAGTIGYVWTGYAIDPLGKTDPYIARLPAHMAPVWNGMHGPPGHNKYDLVHSIIEASPDYIQETSFGEEPGRNPRITEFVRSSYVKARYRGVDLCLRRGSPRVRWPKLDVLGPC